MNINEMNGDLKEMIKNKKETQLEAVYAYSDENGRLLSPWFTSKVQALDFLLNTSTSLSKEYSPELRKIWDIKPYLISIDTELDFQTYKTNSEELTEFYKVNIIADETLTVD